MQDFLKVIGGIIIVIGILACIIIVNSMTIEVPYGFVPGTHAEPHSLRWPIGLSILISTSLTGIFFLSIGTIIDLLSQIVSTFKKQENEQETETNDITTVREEENKDNNNKEGICPNCDAIIPLSSDKCPNCIAVFSPDAAWKVLPK